MPNSFDTLIPDARAFLADLARNNRRDWFAAHKTTYDSRLKRPAELLLDQLAADLQKLTGTRTKTKLFRPQRDVRFSKDKTPYHTHLHMFWITQSPPPQPGWFFGISPDTIRLGAGIMDLNGPALTQWREGASSIAGATLIKTSAALLAAGYSLDSPALKRVPTPYGTDHPQADLLRRKSYVLWRDLPQPASALPAVLRQEFTQLWPMQQRLRDTLSN